MQETTIGIRIRRMREYQNLSREKLAEAANISTQFLADIEADRKGMTVVTLRKLCEALHVSADSIVFGTEGERNASILPLLASLSKEKQKTVEEILCLLIKAL